MNAIRTTAAAALIISAGIVQGAWTNRWRVSPAIAGLAARFESVPMVIGDWKATARKLSPNEKDMTGAQASLVRVYTNRISGDSVSIMLLGGLPGSIGSHSPEVCYPGAGYTLSESSRFDYKPGPDRPTAEFRTAIAARAGINPSVLRIFWGWNHSAGWTASDNVRWQFASEPALCKLYVVRETGGADVKPEHDPCISFLRVVLPELDRYVFPNANGSIGQGTIASTSR